MGITNNSFPHLSNGDNVFSARRHRRQGSPARSSRLDRRQAGAERPEGDRCPLRGHPDLGLLLPCQARVRRLYAQAPLGQAFKVGPLPPPRAVPHSCSRRSVAWSLTRPPVAPLLSSASSCTRACRRRTTARRRWSCPLHSASCASSLAASTARSTVCRTSSA